MFCTNRFNDIRSCPTKTFTGSNHPLLSASANYVIFFDLDETLYDHSDKTHHWFHQLDEYLHYLHEKFNLIFGILTGCNILEAQQKLHDLGFHNYPHFIAYGFGTELYYKSNNEYIQDELWKKTLNQGYSKSIIDTICKELKKQNIVLVPEQDRSANELKDSFYYYESDSQAFHLKTIRALAKRFNIKVIISKCNKNIGDPANAFDIDFIPKNSGKENVAKYIIKCTAVNKNNVFAFGDSENDLSLIKTVANGYAVANSTAELKLYVDNICPHNYSHGILNILYNYFEECHGKHKE